MNVSPAAAELLRLAGAAFAATEGYVIVTHDLDFPALHARSNATSRSIILIRSDDLSVPRLVDKLVTVTADIEPELADGALVTIDLQRTRVRILPIRPQ